MDTLGKRLDAAIIAFRKEPNKDNEEALLEAQRAYSEDFHLRVLYDIVGSGRVKL